MDSKNAIDAPVRQVSLPPYRGLARHASTADEAERWAFAGWSVHLRRLFTILAGQYR